MIRPTRDGDRVTGIFPDKYMSNLLIRRVPDKRHSGEGTRRGWEGINGSGSPQYRSDSSPRQYGSYSLMR